MVVINVLRYEHRFDLVFKTKLLKLQNGVVTCVRLTLVLKFIKVVVPFPAWCRILLEKLVGQNRLRVSTAAILFTLFPESFLAPKSRYSAGRRDAGPRQYQNSFLIGKSAACLFRSCHPWLMLVLSLVLKTTCKSECKFFDQQ
jgi:hypothetical protein